MRVNHKSKHAGMRRTKDLKARIFYQLLILMIYYLTNHTYATYTHEFNSNSYVNYYKIKSLNTATKFNFLNVLHHFFTLTLRSTNNCTSVLPVAHNSTKQSSISTLRILPTFLIVIINHIISTTLHIIHYLTKYLLSYINNKNPPDSTETSTSSHISQLPVLSSLDAHLSSESSIHPMDRNNTVYINKDNNTNNMTQNHTTYKLNYTPIRTITSTLVSSTNHIITYTTNLTTYLTRHLHPNNQENALDINIQPTNHDARRLA